MKSVGTDTLKAKHQGLVYDFALDMSKAVQNTFGVPVLPQKSHRAAGLS
jgi:hypothetical protein